jgi:glycosyltransferase 2 family protein
VLRAVHAGLSRLSPRFVFGTNLVVASVLLALALSWFGGPALVVLSANPSWIGLCEFAGAVLAVLLLSAVRWRLVLRGLGQEPSLTALTLHGAAGQSVSMLVPSARLGGDAVRAYLLAQDGMPAPVCISTVAVDRVLDMGATLAFAVVFATLLLQVGVPALSGGLVTMLVGAIGLGAGVWLTVRRLRSGRGVVTALARATRLDRLGVVARTMDVLVAAEAAAAELVGQRRRMMAAFALGVGINLVVLVEYWLLLRAFALPADPLAVVAAIFGVGAASSMPVPAGVGVLEGAQMFLFSVLGYPPEVGLAVGLAVRLRMLVWVVPGLLHLAVRGAGWAWKPEAGG